MNYAYILLPLLGLLWTLVGITISEAKQNGMKPQHFYLLGTLCSSMLLLVLNLFAGTGNNLGKDQLPAIICYILAAFLNGSGQALSMSNLKQNGRALAYSIPLLERGILVTKFYMESMGRPSIYHRRNSISFFPQESKFPEQ